MAYLAHLQFQWELLFLWGYFNWDCSSSQSCPEQLIKCIITIFFNNSNKTIIINKPSKNGFHPPPFQSDLILPIGETVKTTSYWPGPNLNTGEGYLLIILFLEWIILRLLTWNISDFAFKVKSSAQGSNLMFAWLPGWLLALLPCSSGSTIEWFRTFFHDWNKLLSTSL